MIRQTNVDRDLPFQVFCPLCDSAYVHLEDVRHFEEENSGPTRGGSHIMRFSGECGHYFQYVFGNHKGNVFMNVTPCCATCEGTGTELILAYSTLLPAACRDCVARGKCGGCGQYTMIDRDDLYFCERCSWREYDPVNRDIDYSLNILFA